MPFIFVIFYQCFRPLSELFFLSGCRKNIRNIDLLKKVSQNLKIKDFLHNLSIKHSSTTLWTAHINALGISFFM